MRLLILAFLNRIRRTYLFLWGLPLLLIGLIRFFAAYPAWVERYYATGVYPYIARVYRFLLGWVPFSLGDILIFLAILWLLRALWRGFRLLRRRRATWAGTGNNLLKGLRYGLWIYIIFNLCWGLNYNRRGIGYQLGLVQQRYTLEELQQVAAVLVQRLQETGDGASPAQWDSLRRKGYLFRESVRAYDSVEQALPFLRYRPRSVKASLYSYLGNYMGFQGYYNPFSGEGQVNTTVPVVLHPYIACHEMAHQLGYAKEMEANFVGYLSAKASPNPAFRYSTYFDVFWYTYREIEFRDTAAARALYAQVPLPVKRHGAKCRIFSKNTSHPLRELCAGSIPITSKPTSNPRAWTVTTRW
jgi:Protein of unknown function (DUF3810)